MADIEQVPGTLNITQMTRGVAFAFQTVHDGDITGDTFAATIQNGPTVVPIGITASYNGTSLKTTLTYTLTAANSATLLLSVLSWKMVQTTSGVARPILAGTWGVVP